MGFTRNALTLAIATTGALLLAGCGGPTAGTGKLGSSSVTCATVTGCSGATTTGTNTTTGTSGTWTSGTGTTTGSNGGDDDGEIEGRSTTVATLAITPSLGAVQHATLRLYDASLQLLGSGDSGTGGAVGVPQASGPVVIEVAGNPAATYFDEASATTLPFTHGSLHAAVPSGRTAAGVTILTEVAWQLLARANAPLNDANIVAANEAVRVALAPGLPDILQPPSAWTAGVAAGSLTDTPADQYALLLAALAFLGDGGTPALGLLDALDADLLDGHLDAVAPASAGVTLPYASTAALDAALQQRLAALATLYADGSLQARLAALAPGTFSIATPAFTGVP